MRRFLLVPVLFLSVPAFACGMKMEKPVMLADAFEAIDTAPTVEEAAEVPIAADLIELVEGSAPAAAAAANASADTSSPPQI